MFARPYMEGMVSKELLPDRIGSSTQTGLSTRTVPGIGGIAAAFTWLGELGSVTSFASIAS